MNWEIMARLPHADIRRSGRYIAAELKTPHRTLSTSAVTGGQSDRLTSLVNHQSCEGAGHDTRHHYVAGRGEEAYHNAVCAELGFEPSRTASMATAANMNYAAVVCRRHADVGVTAIVTAGVESNATCAGDPASWHETTDSLVAVPAGTINTMLVIDAPLTPGALARAVLTMAEAKSAALTRLAVPSKYSTDLATGTGTDQYCVAAPLAGRKPLTSASPHTKFGEIVGVAVRDATLEALRWQNGLEASFTRGIFHALGRYGLSENGIFERLRGLLSADDLDLLKKNAKAAFYEPLVGASAYALAGVLDRIRYGTLPGSCARDCMIQQAALLAANLAARPEHWPRFRAQLHEAAGEKPDEIVAAAIALGWSEKWRTN